MGQQTNSKCSVAGRAGNTVGSWVLLTLDPSLLLFDPRNRTGGGRKIGDGVVHSVSLGQDEHPCRRTSHSIPIEIGGVGGVCYFFSSFRNCGRSVCPVPRPTIPSLGLGVLPRGISVCSAVDKRE